MNKKTTAFIIALFTLSLFSSTPLFSETYKPTPTLDWENPNSVNLLLDSISKGQYTDTLYLSLEEAEKMAIKNNRALLNASIDIKRARAQRWQAIAKMLPQGDVNVNYSNDFHFYIDITGSEMPNSVSHGFASSLTLSGPMVISALIQKTAIKMQQINYDVTENSLLEDVNNFYLTILLTKDIIKLQEKYLSNLQTLYNQSAKMVEVGVLEQAQADLIKINVNRLKTTLNNNVRGINFTEQAFKIMLPVDNSTKVILTDSIQQFFTPENLLSDLLQPFQLSNNLNYQLSQQNLKIAKQNWHMAGWAFGPTMQIRYSNTRNKYFGNNSLNLSPTNLLTVAVSFPILSSGDRIAGVIDKKLAYLQQENTLQNLKDNLQTQYKQLTNNLINSYENYINEKENIEAIDHILQNVTNKQKWGVSSTQELITASDDLIQSQQSYLSTMMSLIQNKTALKIFLNNK